MEALQHSASGRSEVFDKNASNLGFWYSLLYSHSATRHLSSIAGLENGPSHWSTLQTSTCILQRGVPNHHLHLPPMLRALSAASIGKSNQKRGGSHEPSEDSDR